MYVGNWLVAGGNFVGLRSNLMGNTALHGQKHNWHYAIASFRPFRHKLTGHAPTIPAQIAKPNSPTSWQGRYATVAELYAVCDHDV